MRILILVSALLMMGCATTYKEFKTSNVKPDEGVAIGKVIVKYNGQNMNPKCAVCFNSVNGPCQKLTDEGFVFQNVKRGNASLRRVVCQDVSMQHYNIDESSFALGDGVTYFGEAHIDWKNKGGFKVSSLFGIVGALISESSNDGTVKMSVRPGSMEEVLRAYKAQTRSPKLQPVVSLAKAGK